MEETFDINDLLKDKDLQNELYSLGWREEVNEGSSKKPKKEMQIEDLLDFEPVSIDGIGEVHDSDLDLNEEDLNDKDLLSMYDQLHTEVSMDLHSEVSMDFEETLISTSTVSSSSLTLLTTATVSSPTLTPPSKPIKPSSTSSNPTPSLTSSTPPPPVSYKKSDKVTAEEARKRAIQCKRDGEVEDAIFWFRKSKELDLLSSNKVPPLSSTSHNSSPRASQPNFATGFESLESVLSEVMAKLLSEAKELKEKDPKRAVEKMKEYKSYQQEMNVLKSRQFISGAKAPGFHWKTIEKKEKFENTNLKEDELAFKINKIQGLSLSLKPYSSKGISLRYQLSLLSNHQKEKEEENFEKLKRFDYKMEDDSHEFDYSIIFNTLKRGKVSNNSNLRKKLTIILNASRGFFSSSIDFAIVIIPMSEFSNKCEISGTFPFYSIEKNDQNSFRKGKSIGGTISLSILIRKPFSGDEIRVKQERVLVVEPWPLLHSDVPSIVPSTVVPPASITTSLPPPPPKSKPDEDEVILEVLPLPNPPLSNPLFKDLSDKEKQYPDSIEFIESNDVLDIEIASIKDKLSKLSKDSAEIFTLQLKLQSLEVKSQYLVYQVQNEVISFEDYLNMIRNRFAKDKILAIYCKHLNTKSSLIKASTILKRIKIMENEIKTAEEAAKEED